MKIGNHSCMVNFVVLHDLMKSVSNTNAVNFLQDYCLGFSVLVRFTMVFSMFASITGLIRTDNFLS